MSARKPDYRLKALNTKTDQRTGELGAGWMNDDGSISLKINWMVRLKARKDVIYTLFPIEEKKDVRD